MNPSPLTFGEVKTPCGDCWDGHCTMNCGPRERIPDERGLKMNSQQLVARIKRSSKYWGQTPPNQWFDVRVVSNDYYQLRGNNNNYRLSDVVMGIRFADGVVVDLSNGKKTQPSPRKQAETCDDL